MHELNTIVNHKVSKAKRSFSIEHKVKTKDVSFLCKQLSFMLEAGISIVEALEEITNDLKDKHLKSGLSRSVERIKQGTKLSDALRDCTNLPKELIQMISCGEESGKLEEMCREADKYFTDKVKFKSKIKKAMTYPIITVVITIAVVIVLMVFVIPNYVSMLECADVEMPFCTRLVIDISNFMSHNLNYLILGMIIIGAIVYRISQITTLKIICYTQFSKIPVIGKCLKLSASFEICNILGLLIHSGISILNAIEITMQTIKNEAVKQKLIEAMIKIREGSTLANSLEIDNLTIPEVKQMIRTGERSGSLDEMLLKTSQYIKEELDTSIECLVTFIEPAMMLMIAVVVGGIMLAIMLPTFTMATSTL